MNPLQFLSKTVTSVLSATEGITKSRTSSTENWEKVGGDLSPTMISPQNNRHRSRSSSESLIDVDEISSISSDSEKNSAWLLPEGVTAVPHALTKIRTQFQNINLSPDDKHIRENALTRLCIPTYVLNQSFPEKEQAEYEEKRRRHRESLTPKRKTNNFHTLPSQIVNNSVLNSTSDNETIRESESQNFEFSVDSESMENSFQNSISNNNTETPEPAETTNRRRVISVPQNLSTLSGSSITSSHASIELKPQSSSKLKPSVGLKPQRRSPLPSAHLAAQKRAEDETENSAEIVTTTSSLSATLKPASRTRPSSRSRGVSPARISSRNQSPVNLVDRSKTTIDQNTPTNIPALKKPASRLPRPGMNRGNTAKFGFKPKKREPKVEM